MRSRLAVVILAGGQGSRIGGAKPLRRLGGERLIDRSLRQARTWSGLVAVSVRDADQVQPVDAEIVIDEHGVEGPLAGLVSALRFAKRSGSDLVLTIPADMPFLPDDLADRLLAGMGTRACALASSGAQVHPVCALWRTSVGQEIEPYLESGRTSLKGLAAFVGFETIDWPIGGVDPFFNINSGDDLRRAGLLV